MISFGPTWTINVDHPERIDTARRQLIRAAAIKCKGDSEKLLDLLEPLQIRGSADGYEFNGYDYACQTWLDFQYDSRGQS